MKFYTDIPIKFINSTNSTDFEVLVFSKNYVPITLAAIYVAWEIIHVQTSLIFVYQLQLPWEQPMIMMV